MMSVREVLNKNRTIGYTAAAILVLAGLAALGFETIGKRYAPSDISTKAFFTTEDQLTGADEMNSVFVDDATKAPPFDHNGKPAYLAVCFVCDGGRVKWVSYLKRYTSEMRARVQAADDAAVGSGAKYAVSTADFDVPGTEVKRPGSGPWIKASDPKFSDTKSANPPNGVPSNDLDLYVP